ncbi:MAG: ABC transporter ATP-binding protein [Tissierellia bacterium]|nr:ABC transporter ATP-binding protein [Tissierellia bacterium]
MLVEVKNLNKSYGDLKALDQVSFEAEKQEIICVLGPSGCGKTTLLQSLGGFVELDSGTIMIDGKSIEKLAAEDRPVATVFQSYGLFPHMSVLDNIIYGLKFRNYKKKAARQEGMVMVRTLGLEGHENKKVTQLSGGQQQRVALGRALIVRPKLLLLDEPFSNLDTRLRDSMRQELLRIRDIFGITMVFVTHDQEDAFSIADRIILMNHGRLEQIGGARDVYDQPASDFVLNFLGRTNLSDEGYVRPEAIRLVRGGRGARIVGKVFKGFYSQYTVEDDKGSYQVISLEDDFEVGQEVGLEMEIRSI